MFWSGLFLNEGDEGSFGCWLPERRNRFTLGLADARSLPALASDPLTALTEDNDSPLWFPTLDYDELLVDLSIEWESRIDYWSSRRWTDGDDEDKRWKMKMKKMMMRERREARSKKAKDSRSNISGTRFLIDRIWDSAAAVNFISGVHCLKINFRWGNDGANQHSAVKRTFKSPRGKSFMNYERARSEATLCPACFA